MAATETQKDIFKDYSALFRAMLPQAYGFLFHDRKLRFYYRDEVSAAFEPTKEYQIALLQTLKHGEQLGEYDHLRIGEHTAYLFQVHGDSGSALGVISVLVADELADRPKTWFLNQIKPALESLERELNLRYRLVQTHRKYQDKASDHQFLRQLGEYSRTDSTCEEALESILNCCAEHLKLEGASLIAPDRGISVHSGRVVIENREATMLVENMNEQYETTTQPESRAFKKSAGDSFNCAVLEDQRYPIGILSIATKADGEFEERLQDIVEPLASSIEFVIERDFDSLTGLPKWPVFERHLTQAYDNNDGRYTLMHFDIDRMQLANDTFGRSLGDGILHNFGGILKTLLAEHKITRISGNYFAALLHEVDTDAATKLAESVCAAVEAEKYSHNGKRFKASVSVGIAPLVPSDDGAKAALGPAQVACEAAKDRGRGRVEIYQSADESIVKRLDDIQMIGTVKAALEEGRMTLYAQPLAHLTDGTRAEKFEILIRMLDEAGNMVEPGQFLSAAERFQVMPEIDQWVIEHTIAAIMEHEDKIRADTVFAINLSGQSIGDKNFAIFLRNALSTSGISPERICFEITETVAVASHRRAQSFMREFRALGCHFSLDDFGTGLSSFAYLKLFPVTSLKIDGTFISDIEENEVSRAMVTAIAEISKVLELETVAEFVGSKESVDILRAMGITWAQGNYVGKPRPLQSYLCSKEGGKITRCAANADNPTVQAKSLPADFMPDLAKKNMAVDQH